MLPYIVMNKSLELLRSKLKVEILNRLQEEELTPLMLSKLIKKPRASVSRAIIELGKSSLVKCINNDDDRWRFYQITLKGKEQLKKIRKFL